MTPHRSCFSSNLPVQDRLNELGLQYERRKDELRALYREAELATVTASPSINVHSKAIHNTIPVQERLQAFYQQREERLKKLREDAEKAKEVGTFTPEISSAAKKLSQRTAETVPDLLYEWGKEAKKRRDDEQKKMAKELADNVMKGPRLDEHSIKLVEREGRRSGPDSIADHLLSTDRKRRESTQEKMALLAQLENPGSPQITPLAHELRRSLPVSERLYQDSQEQNQRKAELWVRQRELEGAGFGSPRILPFPLREPRVVPVDVKLYNQDKQLQEKRKAQVLERIEQEDSRHHPVIDPRSARLAGTLPVTPFERLTMPLSQRVPAPHPRSPQVLATPSGTGAYAPGSGLENRHLHPHDEMLTHEERQMMECTFKPKLDRKSERMEARLRSAQGDRASWLMEKSAQYKERIDQLRHELEDQERRSCPFTPDLTKSAPDGLDAAGGVAPPRLAGWWPVSSSGRNDAISS
eukprot:GAFH01001536.1.p1 GENE.GAFH01001536.1~~GAFH01001536.1.p1  ORF type:complete len:469 (-),score=73.54 GAFH01001536.1:54-1460(-)